jgi:hypothetical protein
MNGVAPPPVEVVTERNEDDRIEAAVALILAAAAALGLLGRWRSGTLTAAQARTLATALVLDGREELAGLTRLLLDGGLRLPSWHRSMRDAVLARDYAATLAILGAEDPGEAEREDLRRAANRQMGFLARFKDQLGSGDQLLDGTAESRAAMYASAAWGVGMGVLHYRQIREGAREARRNLGVADHCYQCVDQASLGWQPIGVLIPIGGTICSALCHCWISYR